MRKVPQTPPLPNPPGMAAGLLAFAQQLHSAVFAYLAELAALANQLVDRVTDGLFTTLTVTGDTSLEDLAISGDITGTGNATFTNITADDGVLKVDGAAGTYRLLNFSTDGSTRFLIGLTNEAESGSSAGSNIIMQVRADDGATNAPAINIERSTGNVGIRTGGTITDALTVNGTVNATTFEGSGASLTSIPAGQLTGTVASARLSGAYTGITDVGTLTDLTVSGDIHFGAVGPGSQTLIDVTNDDFIVRHQEGGALNVIWKSSANDKLYLGTAQYPVRVRSNIETDSTGNDIGSSSEPFDNVFMNQLNVLTFSETGASIGKRIESTFGSLDSSRDSTASVNHQRFYNPNGIVGTISTSASSTAYNTSSDYRLKVNYGPIPDALARVSAIPVYRGEFITNPGVLADYFIAHEVQPYVPEAVTGEKDAVDENGTPIYQGIDQGKLVPLHHAAIQALLARIEALEAQLEALTNA